MKCNQCGTEVPDQSAFCPKCGAQLGAAAGARPPAAARLQPGVPQGTSRDVPEDELWEGAYSPKAMIGWYILVAVLIAVGSVGVYYANAGTTGFLAVAIGGLILFAYLFLYSQYKHMSVHYRLTTHRLVVQKGILSRTDERIMLVDIDDITVRQGVMERMFNVGTIVLRTTDETTKEESPDRDAPGKGIVTMQGIENPRQVGDVIDESRRAERTRRGVYMMNA